MVKDVSRCTPQRYVLSCLSLKKEEPYQVCLVGLLVCFLQSNGLAVLRRLLVDTLKLQVIAMRPAYLAIPRRGKLDPLALD